MAQDPGGSGHGQGEVDWDAVFRTIDHQSVAVADSQSGTLQSWAGVRGDHPWAGTGTGAGVGIHPHSDGVHGDGDPVSEAALLEYFSRQWTNNGGSSNQRREVLEPITMDPSSGLGIGLGSEAGPSHHYNPGHLDEQYDLAFRAMLGEEASVPPPQNRALRGRRRSRSLGPRRTLSDSMSFLVNLSRPDRVVQTDSGPLTGPMTSHPTFPHYDLPPNTPQRPFVLPSTLLWTNNPDVYSFFPSQQDYRTDTAEPSTPARMPDHNHNNHNARPGRDSKRQSASTSGSGSYSQRPTPLNSALPSPQAYRSGDQGSRSQDDFPSTDMSSEPTPGGELDSEDKRARNTMASARFRAKRKAHINDVERQITHLEGQSTILTKEVEDLRKENGFLKDMVQLKYSVEVEKRV